MPKSYISVEKKQGLISWPFTFEFLKKEFTWKLLRMLRIEWVYDKWSA